MFDRLRGVLACNELGLDTIAAIAETIAIDARFNLSVAEKKRGGEQMDLCRIAEKYEGIREEVKRAVAEFEESGDQKVLRAALFEGGKALRLLTSDLGNPIR